VLHRDVRLCDDDIAADNVRAAEVAARLAAEAQQNSRVAAEAVQRKRDEAFVEIAGLVSAMNSRGNPGAKRYRTFPEYWPAGERRVMAWEVTKIPRYSAENLSEVSLYLTTDGEFADMNGVGRLRQWGSGSRLDDAGRFDREVTTERLREVITYLRGL
jgi:hypothetical protein